MGRADDSIWDEAIFGVDVFLIKIAQQTTFSPTFARMPEITSTVYSRLMGEDYRITKKLTKPMLHYYNTGLLWARLLDLKAKRAHTMLTDTEREYRRCFVDQEFNVPEPMALMLKAIGHVKDERGNLLYLDDHTLPTVVAGGKSGYFSNTIDAEWHNYYEEIPTLGVAGDVLMATAGEPNTVPTIPILPDNTHATTNLLGFTGPTGFTHIEIKQFLASCRITTTAFQETVANTRLNLPLMLNISAVLAQFKTFRLDRLVITNMTTYGSECQLMKTIPQYEVDATATRWVNATVQPLTFTNTNLSTIGATYFAGFQLLKEAVGKDNTNWCCVTSNGIVPWVIPDDWVKNRNIRRALPPNYEPQFVGPFDSQEFKTTNIIAKMVKRV